MNRIHTTFPEIFHETHHFAKMNIILFKKMEYKRNRISFKKCISTKLNCAPLVADLSSFFHERDFMLSLSDNKQADDIKVFNATPRYLEYFLNINYPYLEQMAVK